MGQIHVLQAITYFLTGVVKQQRTIAAIPIFRIQRESGVIQWIHVNDGQHATFHSAVSMLRINGEGEGNYPLITSWKNNIFLFSDIKRYIFVS